MAGEEIKQLEQQIDKNSNQILEEKEILDFIKNEENLKALGNTLNSIRMQSPYLSQKILTGIEGSTLLNSSFQHQIGEKIQKNQALTEKELQLLYLQAQIDPNCFHKPLLGKKSTLAVVGATSFDRYGGEIFIQYLRIKYRNPSYGVKKITPFLKDQKSGTEKRKKKEVTLPHLNFREGFSNVALNKLEQRAKENFYQEITKEKRGAQLRNKEKGKYKEDFISYDLLLFAFNKYAELVNKKQENLIKASGYQNAEEFSKQLKLIQEFNQFLGQKTKEKFPNLDQVLASFSAFQKEQQALEKKYFKSDAERQTAEKTFKNAFKYEESVNKKYNIQNIQNALTNEPKTPQEAQQFFEHLNTLQAYQAEFEGFQQRTKNAGSKYRSYLQAQQSLIQKYGQDKLKADSTTIQNYMHMLSGYKKAYSDINFTAYAKYTELSSKKRLNQEIASMQSLKDILLNPLNNNFPIYLDGVKNAALEKQAKQAARDQRRKETKENFPISYTLLNAGASLWNGLIGSTVEVGSSLGLMLMKIWKSDDEWQASAEYKEKFDDFFRIDLSTEQKTSIYDFETGEFNLNWDNGVSQVASGISQMLTLIYGGGALAKGMSMGAAKAGLQLSGKIASKAGLFSMAFTQQVGRSFEEGMQAGMDGKEALTYSFLFSGLQGGLELISPNEVLLGRGSGIAKGFIKELCKKGSKQSLKQVGKLFTQTIGKEIFEENIQEAVQLVAGNLINEWANEQWGSNLPSDWNWKNFAATAVITSLTTGITTGGTTMLSMPGMLNNQDKESLKTHILNDPELHREVMQVLEQAIGEKIKLNLSKEELVKLRDELTITTEVLNRNEQTKESGNKGDSTEKYFEGKTSKLGLSEAQARQNSQGIDQIVKNSNNLYPEESQKSNTTQLKEFMIQYPELRETINEHGLSLQGIEYFLQTESGKEIFDKMFYKNNFSSLPNYKKTFELLEINPGNLREKIQELGNIPLEENTLNLLIHGHIENLQYLIQHHIIDVKTIHQKYNYDTILADLVSLINPSDFVDTLEALGIKTFEDLKTYQYLILDPISTLTEKQIYMKKLTSHTLTNRNAYQNLIYKKLHEKSDLSVFDKQHLESAKYSLSLTEGDLAYENQILEEITTCPPLSFENKLRLYALLGSSEAISVFGLKYYSKSRYLDSKITRKYLTPFEDNIIGSREGSDDLTQKFVRNGKHPPLHSYLIGSISNDLLSKLPIQKGIIYRGVNRSINELSISLGEIKVGSIIQDPAIPNFTSRQEDASGFAHGKTLFVINSKTAKLYQEGVEEHILYPQNTPMKVIKIEHNINGIENIVHLEETYFEGKTSKFGISEAQARQNSQWMDQILSTLSEHNQAEQLQNLNAEISKQYQEATEREGQPGKEVKISEVQALFLIDPSNKKKWKENYPDTSYNSFEQVFPDSEVRGFLIESGFVDSKSLETHLESSSEINTILKGKERIVSKFREGKTFELPIKNGKCEYMKIGSNGQLHKVEINQITQEEAANCFQRGLDISGELMEGEEWVILSSGSLFLNIIEYPKLGGDIDIATDVGSFYRIALNKNNNGKTRLEMFEQQGKIRDIKFTTIANSDKELNMNFLSQQEIDNLIKSGNLRVEFNIISPDGYVINSEFFPEPPGFGLIQPGTPRTEGKINTYHLNSKELKTVNEELAGMSYLINLAHEVKNNSIEGVKKGKKLKDTVRLNNLFEYLSGIGITTPNDIIDFIDKTIKNYKTQKGNPIEYDGKIITISPYLESGLSQLNSVKELLTEISYDRELTQSTDQSGWGSETKLSFYDFISQTTLFKTNLVSTMPINKETALEQLANWKKQINLTNPQNFAYYYEIYQLQKKFIEPIFAGKHP